MALLEGKNPAERKKMIVAIVLGALALISLAYMFLGSSSKTTTSGAKPKPSPTKVNGPTPVQVKDQVQPESFIPQVIPANMTLPAVPEAGRSIFAFYIPPTPTPTPIVTPTPIPTPTPV